MEQHNHGHSHSHSHTHGVSGMGRAFIIGIVLNLAFVAAEFWAGFRFDSLALISDAGHNLSDVVSLLLALLAFRLAKVKASANYTFGYRKSTILVSLLNAVILLIVVGGIFWESIRKISHPIAVEGGAIAWVAGIGVFINAVTALLFLRGKDKDLNVKGAYLHMIADALVSVGVLASGIVIKYTGWNVIDPLIGMAVAVVILFSTWGLLRESVRLSLDGVPAGMDLDKIRTAMERTDGVGGVHHLHVWAISTTDNALTAHVVLNGTGDMCDVKKRLKKELAGQGISHATLEFEKDGEHCVACETGSV